MEIGFGYTLFVVVMALALIYLVYLGIHAVVRNWRGEG